MDKLRDRFRYESMLGDPIVVGGLRIIPESRTLVIPWPGGGFCWNRPVGLYLERNGQTNRVPIVDTTRWAIAGAVTSGILFALLIWGLAHLNRRD